jgi:hypothetical protein
MTVAKFCAAFNLSVIFSSNINEKLVMHRIMDLMASCQKISWWILW